MSLIEDDSIAFRNNWFQMTRQRGYRADPAIMPFDLYLDKSATTDDTEAPSNHDYFSSVLKDRRPDRPLFESDRQAHSRHWAEQKLDKQYAGMYKIDVAAHPELFVANMYHEDCTLTGEPRMDRMRGLAMPNLRDRALWFQESNDQSTPEQQITGVDLSRYRWGKDWYLHTHNKIFIDSVKVNSTRGATRIRTGLKSAYTRIQPDGASRAPFDETGFQTRIRTGAVDPMGEADKTEESIMADQYAGPAAFRSNLTTERYDQDSKFVLDVQRNNKRPPKSGFSLSGIVDEPHQAPRTITAQNRHLAVGSAATGLTRDDNFGDSGATGQRATGRQTFAMTAKQADGDAIEIGDGETAGMTRTATRAVSGAARPKSGFSLNTADQQGVAQRAQTTARKAYAAGTRVVKDTLFSDTTGAGNASRAAAPARGPSSNFVFEERSDLLVPEKTNR